MPNYCARCDKKTVHRLDVFCQECWKVHMTYAWKDFFAERSEVIQDAAESTLEPTELW